MKISTLSKLLIPAALLALASLNASAATCGSSMSMLTISQSGFSCTLGNLTFSNFFYNYTAGIDTGAPMDLGSAPTPNPTSDISVNFTEITDGSGSDMFGTVGTVSHPLYVVVANYSANNSVNEFQNEHFFVSYLVTDAVAGNYLNQVDAGITGTATADGATASLTIKNVCDGGMFTPIGGQPENNCSQGARNVYQTVSGTGLALFGVDDLEADSSISYQTPAENGGVFDGGISPGGAVLGIYDQADIDGGTTSVTANAAVTSVQNAFVEVNSSAPGAPEPGTFILLGGALIAVGAIRRRKAA